MREFYLDYLGFDDWEHRSEPTAPVDMQVSRGDLALHLSEHHGSGSPGAIAYVYMTGVRELHQELSAKNYPHLRPGLLEQEWGMIDPFYNGITFGERR